MIRPLNITVVRWVAVKLRRRWCQRHKHTKQLMYATMTSSYQRRPLLLLAKARTSWACRHHNALPSDKTSVLSTTPLRENDSAVNDCKPSWRPQPQRTQQVTISNTTYCKQPGISANSGVTVPFYVWYTGWEGTATVQVTDSPIANPCSTDSRPWTGPRDIPYPQRSLTLQSSNAALNFT